MQAGGWVEDLPTTPDHAGTRTCVTKRCEPFELQGYLAHQKVPPPRTLVVFVSAVNLAGTVRWTSSIVLTSSYTSQFKNSCLAEMWSGSDEGSFLRLVDRCITQL